MNTETTAAGIKLRDPSDMVTLRNNIRNNVMSSMDKYVNGAEHRGVRLELSGMHYADKDEYSIEEQHNALLDDKTLVQRLRGDVKLVDVETGKTLDEKKSLTLARVPYLTHRGTFIHNGSNFAPIMQSRLLPGAYTRRRNNGELETHFNTRPGSGSAMRLSFVPSTAQYRLKVGASNVHAYSVLKDLGVSDDVLAASWGKDIWKQNFDKYDKKALHRVYDRMVPKWDREDDTTPEAIVEKVRGYMGKAQVEESVVRRNLPNLFDRKKAASWSSAHEGMAKAASLRADVAGMLPFTPDLTHEEASMAAISSSGTTAFFAAELSDRDDATTAELVKLASEDFTSTSRPVSDAHWMNRPDSNWLEWYGDLSKSAKRPENYSSEDRDNVKEWATAKEKFASMLRADYDSTTALAARMYAIDPLKLLHSSDVPQAMEKESAFAAKNFIMEKMATGGIEDSDAVLNILVEANHRGATITGDVDYDLVKAASDGYLRTSDLTQHLAT